MPDRSGSIDHTGWLTLARRFSWEVEFHWADKQTQRPFSRLGPSRGRRLRDTALEMPSAWDESGKLTYLVKHLRAQLGDPFTGAGELRHEIGANEVWVAAVGDGECEGQSEVARDLEQWGDALRGGGQEHQSRVKI